MQLQRCRISPQISLWGQGQWLLLEKGIHWYRHPWSRPCPLLSPPVSVHARGRRTPSFERRNPPGAACRVIFPGDILLKLCNTWLFFASSHSAPLVSPGALALIYLTGNALSECLTSAISQESWSSAAANTLQTSHLRGRGALLMFCNSDGW